MARNTFKRYAGPEQFTPLSGGTEIFSISEDAAPQLYALAQQFPKEVDKALKSLGFYIHGSMKAVMRAGGPAGSPWAKRSRMHVYRRMDLLKAGQADAVTGQWTHGKRFRLKSRLGYKRVQDARAKMLDRWQGRGILRDEKAFSGRMYNAIRYRLVQSGQIEIGALNPSAAMFLAAVQEGRRGSKGAFQFVRTQPVTPAMRRAFWAAGIPLAKDKTVIGQEERPLVPPVFDRVRPEIEAYLVGKISKYLEKQGVALS